VKNYQIRIESLKLSTRVGLSSTSVVKSSSLDRLDIASSEGNHFVIIPFAEVNKPLMNALHYARQLSGHAVGVHILLGSSGKNAIEDQWKKLNIDIPFLVLDSPNDSVIEPLNDLVHEIRHRDQGGSVTILLSVITGLKWWQRFLHNQMARLIEKAFKNMAAVATICVPFSLVGDSDK